MVRRLRLNPGIVDQNVDRTVTINHMLNGRLAIFFTRYVAAHKLDVQIIGGQIHIQANNRGFGVSEPGANRLANPAGTAGNDDDAISILVTNRSFWTLLAPLHHDSHGERFLTSVKRLSNRRSSSSSTSRRCGSLARLVI